MNNASFQEIELLRIKCENRLRSARFSLLLVVALTLLNIFLLLLDGSTYFLFSAAVPYLIVDLGMLFCGLYPEELYQEELAGMQLFDSSAIFLPILLALLILAVYFVSFLFAGKKRSIGWFVLPLCFFALDFLFQFLWYGFSLDMLIDYAVHIWVIVELVLAVSAHSRLKALPEPIEKPITDPAATADLAPENDFAPANDFAYANDFKPKDEDETGN